MWRAALVAPRRVLAILSAPSLGCIVDANYGNEFRDLFAAHFGTVRAEMVTVRAELAAHRAILDGRIASFEHEVRGTLKGMKSELVGCLVGLWFVSVALAILTKAFSG